jgi:Uma2 family endonuclease
MSVSRAPVTADQLSELPDDGRRYEVIDGVLFVTPAPSRIHQRAQAELHIRLHAYSKALGLEVLMAPTAVRASARTEVHPDLIVLPRYAPGRGDAPHERMSDLVLAIEIISASSARTDRGVKRRLYAEGGAKEYWVVDAGAKRVERWFEGSAKADVCADALAWVPSIGREGLTLDLIDLFHVVGDD